MQFMRVISSSSLFFFLYFSSSSPSSPFFFPFLSRPFSSPFTSFLISPYSHLFFFSSLLLFSSHHFLLFSLSQLLFHACYKHHPSHLRWYIYSDNAWRRVHVLCRSFQPHIKLLLQPKIFSAFSSGISSIYDPPLTWPTQNYGLKYSFVHSELSKTLRWCLFCCATRNAAECQQAAFVPILRHC